MTTTIPYVTEVEFRTEILRAALVPEPPAPLAPAEHFVLDEEEGWVPHPDVAAWEAALTQWGAVPEVRQNGWLYQVVEACVFDWRATGLRPVTKDILAHFEAHRTDFSRVGQVEVEHG